MSVKRENVKQWLEDLGYSFAGNEDEEKLDWMVNHPVIRRAMHHLIRHVRPSDEVELIKLSNLLVTIKSVTQPVTTLCRNTQDLSAYLELQHIKEKEATLDEEIRQLKLCALWEAPNLKSLGREIESKRKEVEEETKINMFSKTMTENLHRLHGLLSDIKHRFLPLTHDNRQLSDDTESVSILIGNCFDLVSQLGFDCWADEAEIKKSLLERISKTCGEVDFDVIVNALTKELESSQKHLSALSFPKIGVLQKYAKICFTTSIMEYKKTEGMENDVIERQAELDRLIAAALKLICDKFDAASCNVTQTDVQEELKKKLECVGLSEVQEVNALFLTEEIDCNSWQSEIKSLFKGINEEMIYQQRKKQHLKEVNQSKLLNDIETFRYTNLRVAATFDFQQVLVFLDSVPSAIRGFMDLILATKNLPPVPEGGDNDIKMFDSSSTYQNVMESLETICKLDPPMVVFQVDEYKESKKEWESNLEISLSQLGNRLVALRSSVKACSKVVEFLMVRPFEEVIADLNINGIPMGLRKEIQDALLFLKHHAHHHQNKVPFMK